MKESHTRREFCQAIVTVSIAGMGAPAALSAERPLPKGGLIARRALGDPSVPLEVLFLGTGSPGIDPHEQRGGACEIVFAFGEPLLFDLGHLGLANLEKAGLQPFDIQRLFFTHTYHYDHFCDFAGFSMVRGMQRGAGLLHVYGPADTAQRIDVLLRQVYAEDIRAQGLLRQGMIQVHTVDNGMAYKETNWNVTSVHVKHGPNALGYRIEAGNKSITISGDIAEPQANRRIAGFPCESIETLARDTDLFIMDACPIHSSPEEIGKAAARANPKKVMLTHVRDLASAQSCRDIVQKLFKGEVLIAENQMRVRI